MASAPTGPTNPNAGVMATSPATAPVTIPSALGLPRLDHSMSLHVNPAIAAEM